jgi:hypothetical protein
MMRIRVSLGLCSVLLFCCLFALPADAQKKKGTAIGEDWVCTLDLHQGDTGTLRFTRDWKGNIEGTTIIFRRDQSFEHAIRGRWLESKIDFKRQLSGQSYQPFEGETREEQDGQLVVMKGRFAAKMAGEWSAECRRREPLVERTPIAELGKPLRVHPSSKPGPSLNTRTNPYKPTSRDRVRFIADARHSSGVSLIEIHVDGSTVKRCPNTHCEFSGGPYPAGTLRWRVSAKSSDGGVTYGTERELVISGAPATGACVITGKAFGSKKDVAKVFVLNLYGPDDTSVFRESTRFAADGSFRFAALPAGRYRIVVDTSADVYVESAPRQQTIQCQVGVVEAMNIEFR